ncbi:hypothetical protein [Kordiimonas pumila]|uniref:Glycosyl transferase family 1 domain-containing protein n=1 Tax=Kordiimonas pumila TaxID=2161677 RepID=A0ABV7D9W5_9PROT|nr:hypothetical protein [Kordiimonas pumila]
MADDTRMLERALAPDMACYGKHLEALVREENLYGALGKTAENFDVVDLLLEIASNYVNVEDFVTSITFGQVQECLKPYPHAGTKGGRRLVVAPCSPLFTKVMTDLAGHFDHIVFIDKFRAGVKVAGKTIQSVDAYKPETGDLCLILTRNTEAAAGYENMFGQGNFINFLKVYILLKLAHVTDGLPAFMDKVHATEKPILFSSPRPMGTLSSTIRELGRRGFSPFWLGSEEVKEDHQVGYSTPRVTDVAFVDYQMGGFIDNLRAFINLQHGTVFFHYEAIYPPNWDFNRVALCYAATIAMIRTVKEMRDSEAKGKLALYMYDAIKPGVKNYDRGPSCGRLYKTMMQEAEAIIFSSYTEPFGDFVENAVRKKLPRVHCHRYQIMPKNRQPRRTDAYHIAIISVMLEEFWEPSRMGVVPYLRDLILDGMHIHYYTGNVDHPKLEEFRLSLPEDKRHQFQAYRPIHDLDELSNELSQYHVGWSLFNMQIFNDTTTYMEDQFTRDAMELFTPTTLPSVIWTSAAAGLPVVCNRDMRGVVDMLPAGMAIPLTLSELGNLKNILDGMDWKAIDAISLESLDIENQIYKLADFLTGLSA